MAKNLVAELSRMYANMKEEREYQKGDGRRVSWTRTEERIRIGGWSKR